MKNKINLLLNFFFTKYSINLGTVEKKSPYNKISFINEGSVYNDKKDKYLSFCIKNSKYFNVSANNQGEYKL